MADKPCSFGRDPGPSDDSTLGWKIGDQYENAVTGAIWTAIGVGPGMAQWVGGVDKYHKPDGSLVTHNSSPMHHPAAPPPIRSHRPRSRPRPHHGPPQPHWTALPNPTTLSPPVGSAPTKAPTLSMTATGNTWIQFDQDMEVRLTDGSVTSVMALINQLRELQSQVAFLADAVGLDLRDDEEDPDASIFD